MPRGFEGAYAYARVCGSLARSFLKEDRAMALASGRREGEVWKLMFGEASPVLPEAELAAAAERALRARPYLALKRIAGDLAREEPFFAALVRKLEFSYVASLAAASAAGLASPPSPPEGCQLEPGLDLGSYPDLARMLERTSFLWAVEAGRADLPALRNALDRRYYAELWAAALRLPASLAADIPNLIRVEAELENVVWSLRLKRYYGLGAREIEGRLVELGRVEVKAAALAALSFRADSRSDWSAWKWSRLVQDRGASEGGEWRLSLGGLEAAARRYLARALSRSLHLGMDSYAPLYAYFRLVELEAGAMRGIVEGIKLGAPAAEIAAAAARAVGGAA